MTIGAKSADVARNSWCPYSYRGTIYQCNINLIAQSAFLIFVLCTARIVWSAIGRHAKQRRRSDARNQRVSKHHRMHNESASQDWLNWKTFRAEHMIRSDNRSESRIVVAGQYAPWGRSELPRKWFVSENCLLDSCACWIITADGDGGGSRMPARFRFRSSNVA